MATPYKTAFKLSLPVLLTFGPLGLVFGFLAAEIHEPWYFAPLFSFLIYAGAVQFVALGILSTHGSLLTLFISTFFIALRNAFYGLNLLERFNVSFLKKAYLIFGLVDGTFALLIANPPLENKQDDTKFILTITALSHAAWVVGTLSGSLLSANIAGLENLEFVLIAFFAILVFEQYKKNRKLRPLLVGAVAMAISAWIAPDYLLLVSILLCFGYYLIGFYWDQYHG